MLWFGKKKKDITEETEDSEIVSSDEIEEEADEEEIIALLNEDDEAEESAEELKAEEESSEAEKPQTPADVVKRVTSIDELVETASSKPIGAIQFMRKENNEVFYLKEVYLRIARVWGSVSMAREYTPTEYARIMLAVELIEDKDAFYVIPGISDEEREAAIISFCDEKYGGGGKKYVKNLERFAKLVKENGDMDEWLAHTKYIHFPEAGRRRHCADR